MRRPLVAGNWKMHGSCTSVERLLGDLIAGVAEQQVDVAVFPTYVHIAQAIGLCTGASIAVGAQDCSCKASGAFTGEVAAQMLCDLGCQWVILGHSERRQYHSESDELIASKLAAVVEQGLRPIVCVGETLEQRESGQAEAVVASQIDGALREQADLSGLVIAYEPVWAIGTGLTASPEQAQDMHASIRGCLETADGVESNATRILYGGSVKGSNAADLFEQPDIDGALVGGAALDAGAFLEIINAAAQ
ncbi:MAG: triose-phosphate isomerase [Halieaceae bacterium]|jgi:triosephosphate isomerase (TIM)|nr:triose-phosphate isomerase [Halieaceae bacterium]